MSTLLVHQEDDGAWYLMVANYPERRRRFRPDVQPEGIIVTNASAQAAPNSIRQYGDAMSTSTANDLDPLRQAIRNLNIFVKETGPAPSRPANTTANATAEAAAVFLMPPDWEPFQPDELDDLLATLETELADVELLMWEQDILITVAEIETFLDELEAAGEAILAAAAIGALSATKFWRPSKDKKYKQPLLKHLALVYADTPDFTIRFINYSATEFKQWRCEYRDSVWDKIITKPADKLKVSGSETLSWLVHGSWAGQAPVDDGLVEWVDDNNYYFGVKIHIPGEFLGAGNSPYYMIRHTGRDDYYAPVDDPATPFTFELEGKYTIDIRPTAGGTVSLVFFLSFSELFACSPSSSYTRCRAMR